MTAAEHAAQRDAVRGSLLCDEQRTHRHDAPARRTQVVPGEQRAASHGGSVPARVYASGGEERGCDPCSPAPTACTGCGRRWGLLTSDRYMSGASSWNGETCPACAWDDDCQPRTVPGTPRTV